MEREIQERTYYAELERDALGEAISVQHAVLSEAGASKGNALTLPADLGAYSGIDGGERELAAAWKQLTQLGRERNALKRELAELGDSQLATAESGRRNLERPERLCGQCGDVLQDRRSTRSFCCNACRQQAYRDSKRTLP